MAAVQDVAGDARPEPETGGQVDDPLLECLAYVTRLAGRPVSEEALISGLPSGDGPTTPSRLVRAAENHGFRARILRRRLDRIPRLVLPAILILEGDTACVLLERSKRKLRVAAPETGLEPHDVDRRELGRDYAGVCIFVQPEPREDRRLGEPDQTPARSWFWGTMWRYRGYFGEAVLTTCVVNVLALATALFIMNVYDRVVPNSAFETLSVLAIGTLMAVAFEFLARNLRGYFLETAARKADVLLAGRLFQQALALTMTARPPSAGAFASQLRSFEVLRDFCTSATVAAIVDLPFIAFFIWVVSLIGGPVYKVPMVMVPVVLLVGLLAQVPLAYVMRRHVRESNLQHGLLVEAVEGMESLKTLNAEGVMQGRWENYTALSGRTAAGSRMLSSFVVTFTALALQCTTIGTVVWGVYLIDAGALSVGALIACVILLGRGMAPLSQVAALLARYQHARAAYFQLDNLMKRPTERPPGRAFLHRDEVRGALRFERVTFAYPGQPAPVLRDLSLSVEPGERVAILGRVGSGKSTLLKLVLGLYPPSEGTITLDGTEIAQYDPTDLRRNVGYVSQDVRLFYGTLRENIALGRPMTTDAEVIQAARIAGLEPLVAQHPHGFDLEVAERGEGLSGGQRQAVAIARAVLRDAPLLLLDEATASMDHATEQGFLGHFARYARGRTVLIVTHKPTMVALAERVVVIDGGKVVADGPRDQVLASLGAPARPAPAAGAGAAP